jgi:hypothetical protein
LKIPTASVPFKASNRPGVIVSGFKIAMREIRGAEILRAPTMIGGAAEEGAEGADEEELAEPVPQARFSPRAKHA